MVRQLSDSALSLLSLTRLGSGGQTVCSGNDKQVKKKLYKLYSLSHLSYHHLHTQHEVNNAIDVHGHHHVVLRREAHLASKTRMKRTLDEYNSRGGGEVSSGLHGFKKIYENIGHSTIRAKAKELTFGSLKFCTYLIQGAHTLIYALVQAVFESFPSSLPLQKSISSIHLQATQETIGLLGVSKIAIQTTLPQEFACSKNARGTSHSFLTR